MDLKALFQITYGMYLLTAHKDGKDNGCIINTCMQVANDPERIAISVLKSNLTCQMVADSGRFALSTISTEGDFALFQRFGMRSGRETDKFADFPHIRRGNEGLLHLSKYSNMYLEGKVIQSIDLGTHLLFLGEVVEAELLSEEIPCSYAYYQKVLKPQPVKTEQKKWVCDICGYVYEGDTLPEDFICPWCNHGASDFSPL